MRCAHCRQPRAPHRWTLSPCAAPKPLRVWLCDDHDVALNAMVLAFANVPNGAALAEGYRTGRETARRDKKATP